MKKIGIIGAMGSEVVLLQGKMADCKEEVKAGRPLIHGARIGFKNAMSAVLDANITTIIAAVVLLITKKRMSAEG